MKNLLKGQPPMYLEKFISKYEDVLKHTRCLYVVEPNLDKGEIVKFGIAGMSNGNSYARLKEYITLYGEKDEKNECKGVKIHFCGVTDYNRLVWHTQTEIHKVENKLKNIFKSTTDALGRGSERTTASIEDVLQKIKEISRKEQDIPAKRITTTRQTSQTYRGDTRAFIDTEVRRSTRLKNK